MATARPIVTVYKHDNPKEKAATLPMPLVLTMPLRPDLVREVHRDMSKNKRQPYAPKMKAGFGTAAESWGTGRAVSRIPRVPGGGTHRSGQGAFGNMCRGGSMSHPNRIWRRWHRKINMKKKRTAVVSCLAASCLPALVMARGHRINEVPELPLVVSDGIESLTKTKSAVATLKKFGLEDELQKVVDSKKIRAGKGKMRNRRYNMRRGPMVVYGEDKGIVRAMRNIPGVTTSHVDKLRLLELAPGGQFGRLMIYTESAFKKLVDIYGKRYRSGCPGKTGYVLPRPMMENADVARIINSDEVQAVLRPKLEPPVMAEKKVNALKSKKVMNKLNPAWNLIHTANKRAMEPGTAEHEQVQAAKKKRWEERKAEKKEQKKAGNTFYKKFLKAFTPKPKPEKEEEEGEDDD